MRLIYETRPSTKHTPANQNLLNNLCLAPKQFV